MKRSVSFPFSSHCSWYRTTRSLYGHPSILKPERSHTSIFFFPFQKDAFFPSSCLNRRSASWKIILLSSFRRITPSRPFSFRVLINGAFRYNASATITSAKCPCRFFSRSINLFPPVSSPSSFPEPSLGFNISCPRITCGDLPIIMHTTLR